MQEAFTPRENDILSLILEGYSSQGIAEKLVLATETVRWYIKQIYSKLDAHSRDEAVARVRELRQLGTDPQSRGPVDTGNSRPAVTFIGREDLVEQLTSMLDHHAQRVITLIGPPGVGKTRLSKEILRRSQSAFEDCHFVDLSAETTADRVGPKIAEDLGLLPANALSVIGDLRLRLRDRSTLLILDNFEQVIDAAPLVSDLHEHCPSLTLIMTSREALRVTEEWVIDVPCLEPPFADAPARDLAALGRVESVALFVQRAQMSSPRFRLTTDNAEAVAEICRRLDGLPLAIELAAARARLMSPDTLLERLETRFGLLSRGARDLPRRHATLRSALSWSYDLLSENERRLFDRLGVFRGGWTLEAAEAVGAVQPHVANVLDALDGLVGKSLASCREDRGGRIRFSFLETIREFAAERLAEAENGRTVAKAHALYFADIAERANAQLMTDQQLHWFARLEDEHDNHRVALRFAEGAGDAELLMRLTGALGWYWHTQSHLLEGRIWSERAVALDQPEFPMSVRIDAYNAAGYMAHGRSEHGRARAMHQMALTLARENGDSYRRAFSLFCLSAQTAPLGDSLLAYEQCAAALAELRQLGQFPVEAAFLTNLGAYAGELGWKERATQHLLEAISISETGGQISNLAYVYTNYGTAFIDEDPAQARVLIVQGLECARASNNRRVWAYALILLSVLCRNEGDLHGALASVQEGYAMAQSVADRASMVNAQVELARTFVTLGHIGQAVAALRAADSYAAETDDSELREAVQRARAELGFLSNTDNPPS